MKVLVIGDACEDVYVYGTSTRMAPEAPVPVFVEKTYKSNGGIAQQANEIINDVVAVNMTNGCLSFPSFKKYCTV